MLAHLLATIAKLPGPGGAKAKYKSKAIFADSLPIKQQLLIINRSRQRAPNLTPIHRILLGLCTLPPTPHSASGSHSQTRDALALSRHAQEAHVSTAILV
jgi:hypothetical protein